MLSEGEAISGNMALCAFVEKSHLFKKVDSEDIAQAYQAGKLYRFKSGDLVLQEGDEGRQLFLMVSGIVKVVAQGVNGQVELARLSRGAIFGEVAFLTGQPRTASVVAVDSAEMIGFGHQALEPILKKFPKVRKTLQIMMAARAEKAIEKTTS